MITPRIRASTDPHATSGGRRTVVVCAETEFCRVVNGFRALCGLNLAHAHGFVRCLASSHHSQPPPVLRITDSLRTHIPWPRAAADSTGLLEQMP
jgi:hypothetical protein